MPLTVQDGALLGAGIWCAAAATYFYRRKQTLPFKVAYFAAWPIAGTAAMLICMPSREGMEKELKEHGLATDSSIREAKQRGREQVEAIKQAAQKSKMS